MAYPPRRARRAGPAPGRWRPLLGAGEVWLALPGAAQAWRAPGPPFLTVLELSRQAVELARAVELGEERFEFEPAGVRPVLDAGLARAAGRSWGPPAPPFRWTPRRWPAALFHLGEALALAFAEADRIQAGNPYLVELAERCREGLSHLRGARAAARGRGRGPRQEAARPAATSPPAEGARAAAPAALREAVGAARAGGAEEAQLLLGRHGPVYCAPELAPALLAQGRALLWRRAASLGVAASADGHAVAADDDARVRLHRPGRGRALAA